MRLRHVLGASALSVPLLIAACGGATSQDTTEPPGKDAGTDTGLPWDTGLPDTSVPKDVSGSYELTFSQVATHGTAPLPPSGESPSPATPVRLDILDQPTGIVAVMTPTFGSPALFTGARDATSITLTGNGAIASGSITDEWKSLHIALDASGALGTFSATGTEDVLEGDAIYSVDLDGSGSTTHDARAPKFRLTKESYGPPGMLLPWDPITVRVSEPIDPARLVLAVDGSPSAPSAWTFTQGSPDDTSWAGVIEAKASFTSYDGIGTVTVHAPQPIPDRAGNAASFSDTVTFASVPSPKTAIALDDETSVLRWGGVTALPPGDAHCESGGCMRFAIKGCVPDHMGIAARVNASSATKIQARLRVLVNSASITSPNSVYPALVFRAPDHVSYLSPVTVKALATPEGTYDEASDWTSITLDVTPSADVGFSLGIESSLCGGGPFLPPYDMMVLVDSIAAAP